MSIAVILMVISELDCRHERRRLPHPPGAQWQFKMVDLWAGSVVLGAYGVLLNAVLALIELVQC